MELTAQQKKQLEQLLKNLEKQLEEDIARAEAASKPVELDQQAVGRVSRIDAIQQQQMQLNSMERMKRRLSMVKGALSRIHSEDFGHCTQCEEPISFERLEVRPESLRCINCAAV